MDLKKIGTFIAEERHAAGLTQAELAEKLTVSPKAVSRWETGRGLPDASLMVPLCNTLGMSVNEMLAGERLDPDAAVPKADRNLVDMLRDRKRLLNRLYALFSALLCLVLMLSLYSNEFCLNVDSNQGLEAALSCYSGLTGETVDVIDSARYGRTLFVLYSSSRHPASSGLAALERGLFGKYRILGRSDSSWPLYQVEVCRAGGKDLAVTYCANVLDGQVHAWQLYAAGPDGRETDTLLLEGPRYDRPFLNVSEASPDLVSHPFFPSAIRYYGADGQQLSIAELLETFPDDGSWGSSTGMMEGGKIYVLELILLAAGVIVVRRFLLNSR